MHAQFGAANPGIITQIAQGLRNGVTLKDAIPPRLDPDTTRALHRSLNTPLAIDQFLHTEAEVRVKRNQLKQQGGSVNSSSAKTAHADPAQGVSSAQQSESSSVPSIKLTSGDAVVAKLREWEGKTVTLDSSTHHRATGKLSFGDNGEGYIFIKLNAVPIGWSDLIDGTLTLVE